MISMVQIYAQDCNPQDTFFDNFDSYSGESGAPLPPCWSYISTAEGSSSKVGVRNTEGEAYSGSNALFIFSMFMPSDEIYLITPELSTIDGSHYADFYIKSNGNATIEYGTMSDNEDLNTYVPISESLSLSADYENITTPNIEAAEGHKYFVIKISIPASFLFVRIDDFSWNAACSIPTNILVSDITENTALISWEENTSDSYIVEYGESGFAVGEGSVLNAESNSITLIGLTPNTSYDLYVKSVCGNDVTSDNASVVNFVTNESATSIEEKDWENQLSVFPNPTRGQLNFKFSAFQVGTIHIYNAYGTVVLSQNIKGSLWSIDVSKYAFGSYFYKLSIGNKIYRSKFVKQ